MHQLAIRINLLIVLVLLATCGGSQRERVIKTALTTVNQMRDTFVVFDRTAQDMIIANAIASGKTEEQAKQDLIAYRKTRESILDGFAIAYQAIATAATLNGNESLKVMLDAVTELARRIEATRAKPK